MLTTYTEGSKTQENLYTGEGQRVQKKEGTDATNYFYQNGSVLYTTDSASNLKTFNLLNVSDIFGTARKNETAEDYYLYTDELRGSTVNVLDSSADKVASYWYNDFGEVTEGKAGSYSSCDNELQYTGAVYDDSTGLLYLNARFYDPQTGRFISRDTYRGEQGNVSTWHLYLYCANNPVNYVDLRGYSRIKAYSAAKTFNYRAFLYLGGLSITLVVKWKVKGKKIFYSSASISRKNAYGVARIKTLKRVEKQDRNQRQRVRIRYFVVLRLSNLSDYFLNKYSLPIHEYCHPSAIVYNDGGVDWYKDGLK